MEALLAEAKEIARLCKSYHVPFVINDNVEIAKKVLEGSLKELNVAKSSKK